MDVAELAAFPIITTVPVAWGEMDAFGHVNNIVYFRYFESARFAYLEAIGFRGDTPDGIGPILASTQCRFRLPLTYPDTVHIGARTIETGDDRFTMEYRIISDAHGDTAAEGGGVIVAYDYRNVRKAALPEEVRARIRDVEGRVDRGGDR
ncbi:MAG: acyl-CoA thioesterase [Gemmatimonadetes bacterium]|nr:acyl-CoA thioesterase [Gemmatimonadota bacterium]